MEDTKDDPPYFYESLMHGEEREKEKRSRGPMGAMIVIRAK
jgi:hypothetical protein